MRIYALVVVSLVGVVACKRVGPGITPGDSARGALLYGKLCALCHGDDREGGKADNAPSLKSPTLLASASDDFLRTAIVRGRPGTAMAGYGKAIGGPLTDADVAALMEFIRQGAPERAVLHAPPPGVAGNGKVLYAQNCRVCHGEQGQRGTAVYLAGPAFLAAASDELIAFAIENGRPGTKMTPWKGTLTDNQISDLVSYIRSWGAPAAPPPPPNPEPKVPDNLPIVLNPTGAAPSFPPLKEDRYVPMADVKAAMDKGAKLVIVDARPPSDWLHVHIPGAISIPYYDMKMIDKLPNDGTWVLTYCACPHHASGIVLDELRKRGFKNSAVIDEGILGWQRAGYPAVDVDGKPAALPPGLPPPAPPSQPGPR